MTLTIDDAARAEAMAAIIFGSMCLFLVLYGAIKRCCMRQWQKGAASSSNSINDGLERSSLRQLEESTIVVSEVSLDPLGSNKPPPSSPTNGRSTTTMTTTAPKPQRTRTYVTASRKRKKQPVDVYYYMRLTCVVVGASLVVKGTIILIPSSRTRTGQYAVELCGYLSSLVVLLVLGWFIHRLFSALQSTLQFHIPRFHRPMIAVITCMTIVSVGVAEALQVHLDRTWPDAFYFIVMIFALLYFIPITHVLVHHANSAFLRTSGVQRLVSSEASRNAQERITALVRYTKWAIALTVVIVPALAYRVYIRFSDMDDTFFWREDEGIQGSYPSVVYSFGITLAVFIIDGLTKKHGREEQTGMK